MDVSVAFEVAPFRRARLIGVEVTVGKRNPVPTLWSGMLKDGRNALLQSLPERTSPAGDNIGWMGDYNPETAEFTYVAGVLAKPGTIAPEGFSYRDIPDCLMGTGWISAPSSHLEKGAHARTEKIMRAHGYAPDYSAAAMSMEYFSYEKYICKQESRNDVFTLGYCIPCKKIDD